MNNNNYNPLLKETIVFRPLTELPILRYANGQWLPDDGETPDLAFVSPDKPLAFYVNMPYVKMTPDNVELSTKRHFDQLLAGMKIVERYQCPECHQLEDGEYNITEHLLGHAIDERIRQLWEQGRTLKKIDDLYHIFHIVDNPESYNSFCERHHNITKDNCFKISYLQCCDYSAYQICSISHQGVIEVWGIGGWDGGYRSQVTLGSLRDPRPLSELYVYKSFKERGL